MRDITVSLCESDRQLTLLALAICSVKNPGFDQALREIANKLEQPGDSMYDAFKRTNS